MRSAVVILSALLTLPLAAQSLFTVHTGPTPTGAPATNAVIVTNLYAVSLDTQTKVATWCGYRVTAASQYGRNSINRNWLNRFPEGTLESQDYLHSGYSIGHLTPLASFRADPDAAELNWMGNVAPQRQALNAGVWLKLEDFARDQARLHGAAYVLVGPLFEREMPPLPEADEPHTVPSHYWCRVRIPDTDELYCWIVPQDVDRNADPNDYAVTCDQVCRRSGLRICHTHKCEVCNAASGESETPDRDREPDENDTGYRRSPGGQLGETSRLCSAAGIVRTDQWWREPTRSAGRFPLHCDLPLPLADGRYHRDATALGHRRQSHDADPACIRSRRHAAVPGDSSQRGRMMPNSVDVFVEANDQADKLLAQLPHELRFNTLPKALRAGANVVKKDAKDRLPDPGYAGDKDPDISLKNEIIVRVRRYDRVVLAIVGVRYLGVNHAHLVEFGHRLVRKLKSLDGSTYKVEIGFVPPHPFLRPAADGTRDDQARAIVNLIKSELEKFQSQFA